VGTRSGDVSQVDLDAIFGSATYSVYATQPADRKEIRVAQVIPETTPQPTDSKLPAFLRVESHDGSGALTDVFIHEYVSWNNNNQPGYSSFVLKNASDASYDANDGLSVLTATEFRMG